MKLIAPILLALLVLATGCAELEDGQKKVKADTAATSADAAATTEPEPEPAPTPEPDGTYTSSCDYVLGDFTSYTQSGYRFIADASIKNTGNIGVQFEVVATWFLSGGGKVTAAKTVKLRPGKRARVGITEPVGQDEIDLHQSLGYNSQTCKTIVRMARTFGAPQAG